MATTEHRRVERCPAGSVEDDVLVVEEPLEIRVEGRPLAVTMRTPGHDLELAAGFLMSEGIIDAEDDLQALRHVDADRNQNTVDCVLAAGIDPHLEAVSRATRELYATSSCGLCGKASIDRLRVQAGPISSSFTLTDAQILALPDLLKAAQENFGQTGGLHAAALVRPNGSLEVVREDIGRHNAVDKVLGWRLLQGTTPVDDRALLVSSRAGFEIIQKALVARVPLVIAVGAASTLAVDLAEETGMELVGFLRPQRFNRYHRGVRDPATEEPR